MLPNFPTFSQNLSRPDVQRARKSRAQLRAFHDSHARKRALMSREKNQRKNKDFGERDFRFIIVVK